MKVIKTELTKKQNNYIAAHCPDPTLKLSAQFGGMCKDYTFYLTEAQYDILATTLDEELPIVAEFD